MENVIILIASLPTSKKKICEDQVRAAGPDGVVGDPINLTEIFSGFGGNGKVVYAGSNSNQFLSSS